MASIAPLASRQYQAPSLQNTSLQSATSQSGGALGNSARAALDYVSLSKSGIALSAQGLADRADAMGNATVDVAQSFISSFAQRLLGDSAQGATLSFDSASLETNSAYAALVQHTSGASGSSDLAAFRLDESAHFIGKGTITTADGQSLSFEIEVEYTSSTAAAASSSSSGSDLLDADSTGADTAGDDGDGALASTDLGNISFPGSLKDLFQLLGRQLQATLADNSTTDNNSNSNGIDNTATGGTLRLRLLDLLNSKNLIDAATPDAAADVAPTTSASDAAASTTSNLSDAELNAKALASAYGNTTPAAPAADAVAAGGVKDRA